MCIKNPFAFYVFSLSGFLNAYIIFRLFLNDITIINLIISALMIAITNYLIYAFFYFSIISYMNSLFSNIEKGNLSFEIKKSNIYLPQPYIKQLNKMIQTLDHKIYYDALTQLPNRLALLKHIDELSDLKSDNTVIYLFDIDNFKMINDNFGHHAGDTLLYSIGNRLTNNLTEDSLLFRLAGDEFVIVSTNEPVTDNIAFTSYLHSILEEPFDIEGNNIHVSISVGNSKYRKSHDILTSIKNADTEMYTEKIIKKKNGD